jgi:hypothetical protein
MKTLFLPRLACLAVAASLVSAGSFQVQSTESDNFNDGNDVGWTRYDPIGSHSSFPDQGTWTFPNGGYRLQAAVSPMPTAVGPGRVGSLRPEIYTDFYVAVDLVNWNESLDQAIGLMARLKEVGLGSTDGYAMTYQVADHDVDITRFVNEDTTAAGGGGSVPLTGEDAVTLVPGRSYRFAFIGKGSLLTARVYELPDTVNPIMEASGTDTTFTSGQCGLLVFDNSAGTMVADATFDNYFATDIEPPRILIEDIFFGDYRLSWPADVTGFVLQSSSTLPGSDTDWQDVSGVQQNTYIFNLFDGTAGDRKFFRLVRH